MNNLPTPEEVERSLHLENAEYENRYTYLRQFAALLRQINGQGTPMVDRVDKTIIKYLSSYERAYLDMRDLAHHLEKTLSFARTEEQERCAKVADEFNDPELVKTIAAAIRALPSEGA